MPTIVFCSPKGGAGKTTAALLLATQLVKIAPVTVVDADPNHPIKAWASTATIPPGLSIVADANEDTIADRIDDAAAVTPFVVVDLEGTASKIVVMAISRADFVIVPTQGSELDAEQASRAFQVIRQHEKAMRRANPDYVLPYSVLLTRTNPAIRARTLAHIQRSLIDAGIPVFKSELNEREAFRGIFSFRQTLELLPSDEVPNLEKAIVNASEFAAEVVNALRTVHQNHQNHVQPGVSA